MTFLRSIGAVVRIKPSFNTAAQETGMFSVTTRGRNLRLCRGIVDSVPSQHAPSQRHCEAAGRGALIANAECQRSGAGGGRGAFGLLARRYLCQHLRFRKNVRTYPPNLARKTFLSSLSLSSLIFMPNFIRHRFNQFLSPQMFLLRHCFLI